MTTDRKDDGVRVRIRATGDTGTVLYGPHKRFGTYWPGFSGTKVWLLPVRLDEGNEVLIYAPEELEPGPPRRPVHAPRRVYNIFTGREGTALIQETVDGVIWPGWNATGSWRIPVEVDGKVTTWDVRQIREPDPDEPEPSPAMVPGEPPYGPRVRVRGLLRNRDRGRVLYRAMASGRVWPDFNRGEWRVPVRMEASGDTLFVPATDLEPYPDPEPVEATILAEADQVANATQAKALRDVAEAAVDALELFTDRLRAIVTQRGDKNAK